MRTWSVELEVTMYADDTFTGTYEECVNYVKENGLIESDDNFQLAEIKIEDGCATFTYDVVKKEDIEL